MAPDTDDSTRDDADSGMGSWLADYSARLTQTAEDSVRAGTAAASRWVRRSLEEGQQWSVDTVTADIIADWEELTPLAGRWLDLWLEAAQQAMKGARPGER